MRRALPFVALALASVLAVAGCSEGADTVAGQARAGDGKGYVAGDGTIEQIQPADRTTTITVRGKTLEGDVVDTASWSGKVVVLNTWGSWCPPCNAEAPGLQRTWSQLKSKDVQFLGVDVREGSDSGRAFQRKFAITYPSLAWDGGGVLLQLKGKASATPTTLVLDGQGRVAARISGEARGTTLADMVEQVLSEDVKQ
ncbi:MAG TPA: TlpA disulfide reductase family protein [Marmoricola sp.]|nr:TlpA disulfide reductase family protein [Marmoricola sp.]